MKVKMELTGQELDVLERLLQREVLNTRGELRRTDSPAYRRRVADQLKGLEHLHRTVAMAEEMIDLTIG